MIAQEHLLQEYSRRLEYLLSQIHEINKSLFTKAAAIQEIKDGWQNFKDYTQLKSFEEFCNKVLECSLRQVQRLLAAKEIMDLLPSNLRNYIGKISHTYSLIRHKGDRAMLERIVKAAVKLAADEPLTAAHFAEAEATESGRKSKIIQMRPDPLAEGAAVTLRHGGIHDGESGTVAAKINPTQSLIALDSGERVVFSNHSLFPTGEVNETVQQNPPAPRPKTRTFTEEEMLRWEREIEARISQELKIALMQETRAAAEREMAEQLEAAEKAIARLKAENAAMLQQLQAAAATAELEAENLLLKQRIQELESRPPESPQYAFNKAAVAVLNKEVARGAEVLQNRVEDLEKQIESISENPSQKLHHLLIANHVARSKWEKLRASGATDAEIKSLLQKIADTWYFKNQSGGTHYLKNKGNALHFYAIGGEAPLFTGKEVIILARALMGIPNAKTS